MNLELIERAASFLEGKVRKTPLEFSETLSEHLQVPTFLKLEFLQLTGSFKIRGALFYLSTLSENERKGGVAACSAGNHGLGVAFAAKEWKIPCTLYVPKNIEPIKYQKMVKLGAEVKKSNFNGYDHTLEWAEKEALKEKKHLISAFDDERIMAANGGTIGKEIFQEMEDVQNVILPVGGGGLAAGLSYYLKSQNRDIRIIGCQHLHSPALKLSLEKGSAVTTLPEVDTLAAGIEGGIGEKCFNILKTRISDVSLVSEEDIIKGFFWSLENHQYLIEPTAAVVLASLAFNKFHLKGKTVVILTGRNVSFQTLKNLFRNSES